MKLGLKVSVKGKSKNLKERDKSLGNFGRCHLCKVASWAYQESTHGAANRQIPLFVAAPVQGAHGMESSPMNRATKRQWVYAASSHALIDHYTLANEISSIILRPNDMLNYNLLFPSFD